MRFSFFAYKFFYYLEISLVYLFFILFIIFFLDLEGEDVCLEKRSPIIAQRHIPKRYKIMLLTKGVEFASLTSREAITITKVNIPPLTLALASGKSEMSLDALIAHTAQPAKNEIYPDGR